MSLQQVPRINTMGSAENQTAFQKHAFMLR